MRIGACRVRLACRLTIVLLVIASTTDKAGALFDPGNDEGDSKQSISSPSLSSGPTQTTTGTTQSGSAIDTSSSGSEGLKSIANDESYLGLHPSLCFVESELAHNICYEPRQKHAPLKEQDVATGEAVAVGSQNSTAQHASHPESRKNGDGEEAASAATEQSASTLQAKEYDAWRERIGGEDAETWLSFDQWRDRYLAAEREKAEQERQRMAASKRNKTDRQNDKGNAAGKHGSAVSSPHSNASSADDSGVDVAPGTSSKQNDSGIEQDPSHGAKESQNERHQTSANDSPTPASEHADGPSAPLQDQANEDTAHAYIENGSEKGDAGASGSTAVADPVGAIPALGNPSDELVNLKHRWNFASLDCAAVVHRTNPSAKFASSILSEKKDRYMLSPCPTATGEVQFVVVELCDEIKIDTLVLANFEFFSRMFKRFRVHASRNLNAPDHEWVDIGVFRARNMRGLQVFKTPDPSGDARFFRYIRIDFMEHYGSEYYCPLSLLRVYGLTQMDDYVREEEEMRKAREAETLLLNKEMDEEEGGSGEGSEAKVDGNPEPTKSSTEPTGNAADELRDADAQRSVEREEMVTTIFTSAAEPTPAEIVDSASTLTEGATIASQKNVTAPDRSNDEHGIEQMGEKKATDGLKTSETLPVADPATSVAVKHSEHTTFADAHADVNRALSSSPASTSSSPVPSSATAASTVASLPSSVVLAPPIQNNGSSTQGTTNNHTHGGSESIYRTITKRLNALEMNATLSLQYMEHSRQMLRETFVRMERSQQDKIGQLLHEMNETNWRQIENLKKRQQSDLQQALFEFDLHRQQTDVERRALLAQVRLLSNEVMLEKRFGIAQLILLLCLFVFMAFTRGSRAAPWVNESLSRLSRTPSARFGDHQPHQRYLKHSAFATSRPNTPSSSGRATLSDDAASQVYANGRYFEQQRYTTRSPGLRSSELKRRRTDQGLPLPRDGDRHPSTVSVRPLISGRKARRRRQGQTEYLVRLPGGINAKVPARRKGEKIVVPAQLISSSVDLTPDLHAQTPSP